MNILMTGGAGFIGNNLVRLLLEHQHYVTVLDNLTTGNAADLEEVECEVVRGDVMNYETVAKLARGKDAIVHLAAHTRVVESVEDPTTNFEVNGKGTLNVLLAARDTGVEHVVFASTGGAILGEVLPPVKESMFRNPISPYGASKLMGEGYCSAFAGAYGLNTTSVRFANVYGPWSYRKGSVVAKFFKDTLDGRGLTIYGDGNQTRDFVYSTDVANGIRLALEAKPRGFEIFNIASGVETSINQLVELTTKVTGREPKTDQQPRRDGEVFRNYASIEKAREQLGYEPAVSLESGLERTWEWFLSSGSPVAT